MSIRKFNPETVKYALGEWYVKEGPDRSFRGNVTPLYEKIGKRSEVLYEQIPVPVIWTRDDPYSSYEEMKETVEADGELLVFAGGTHGDGITHEQNVMGRAVHDWFGHLRHDWNFSMQGEFMKWYNTRKYYPEECERLLFTEIVLQRAAVSYLDEGFADPEWTQHGFEAPESWIDHATDAFLSE